MQHTIISTSVVLPMSTSCLYLDIAARLEIHLCIMTDIDSLHLITLVVVQKVSGVHGGMGTVTIPI